MKDHEAKQQRASTMDRSRASTLLNNSAASDFSSVASGGPDLGTSGGKQRRIKKDKGGAGGTNSKPVGVVPKDEKLFGRDEAIKAVETSVEQTASKDAKDLKRLKGHEDRLKAMGDRAEKREKKGPKQQLS